MKTHRMRFVLLLYCTVVLSLGGCSGNMTSGESGAVSSSNAVEHVRLRVQAGIATVDMPRKSVIQFAMQPLETNMTVKVEESTFRVPVCGYLVFIDEVPENDWAHKAQVLIVPTPPEGKAIRLLRDDIIPNIRVVDMQGNTVALSWLRL